MARNRDDFNRRTKNDLALRASYLCSICKCSTAGPSDESEGSTTIVGVAAHICAAASGAGARRYDPEMSSEERSHITNGIWLCATCSVLIDRDEKRYPVSELLRIKSEHEASCLIGVQKTDRVDNIIAIGSDIIALGSITRIASDCVNVRMSHFVNGSGRELWSLVQDFDKQPSEQRYVLFNETGFGALLREQPVVERANNVYEIQFILQKQALRRNARDEISISARNLSGRISGLDAYTQIFENVLSQARGTGFSDLCKGSEISDLYWRYSGSPWFQQLVTMEMIRLSSIPEQQKDQTLPSTPFLAVNRVNHVEIPSLELKNHNLEIIVDFELEGIGSWTKTLSVYISTPEQLAIAREQAQLINSSIVSIEALANS